MSDVYDQTAKADAGKPKLTLVPRQIIWDIAKIREYGTAKYHNDPENWKRVEKQRYKDAAYRHFMAYLDDEKSVDEEASFFDDGKIPCILIENKIDLLSDEEKLNDDPELNNFAQENEFINCFRTSAKDGININEAMEFTCYILKCEENYYD